MAIYSWSSKQNVNYWRFWIRKIKCIIEFNRSARCLDKIYLYAKDLSEPKYKFFIQKHENTEIKHLNDPNACTECSDTMDDVYEDIDDYSPTRKTKILIVFDDMIADIRSNKNFQAIVKELFIRYTKLNISFAFITQSYFSVPKDVRLNSIHYLIMKINNKREL